MKLDTAINCCRRLTKLGIKVIWHHDLPKNNTLPESHHVYVYHSGGLPLISLRNADLWTILEVMKRVADARQAYENARDAAKAVAAPA